ncbi:MAG: pectate lyase [Ignavibacteriales bacterium]|nr:pectate lyase [Ignavibacteriales bacterium]
MIRGDLSKQSERRGGIWSSLVPTTLLLLIVLSSGLAQNAKTVHWWASLTQREHWYGSPEAIRIADNLLLYQFPSGGWPKNIDMAEVLDEVSRKQLKAINHLDSSTIDNSATYTQLRYLAKVYRETKLGQFKTSFIRGFDYLLRAQYENGGWPQFYPLRQGYYSHITFNDDAMIGAMKLLRDASRGGADFAFLDEERKAKAATAVEKGIRCILKCQIRVNGDLTAWCAQHDEKDFSPAKARTYELPSLSGEESVGIIEFLMGIENPTGEIIASVQAAVKWFKKVKIYGIKVTEVSDTLGPEGRNRIVLKDSSAKPMWARFYEIGTNRPFFCGRDGVKRYALAEISFERRNHYSWLGYWPQRLLEKEYPEWVKKHSVRNVLR